MRGNVAGGCQADALTSPPSEWTYRFNPLQEREQKRQTLNPLGLTNGLAWTYYQIGLDGRTLASYHGIEGSFCGQPPATLSIWPVEYTTTGPQGVRILTRTNGNREYVISDHLGSSRAVVSKASNILQRTDYEPFGGVFASAGDVARTGYIDREEDGESGLGSYGVRLYEPEYGRFTSVDVLWGEYEGWQPYQYGLNSPTVFTDRSGKVVIIESGNGSTTYRFDGTNLLDTKGNVYEGTDEFLQSTLRVLMDLTALGGDAASDIRTLMQSEVPPRSLSVSSVRMFV